MRAEDVVRQGFDEIQHINQVLLNFFVKPTDDTRTLARFSIVAEIAPMRWTSTRRRSATSSRSCGEGRRSSTPR